MEPYDAIGKHQKNMMTWEECVIQSPPCIRIALLGTGAKQAWELALTWFLPQNRTRH